jgi:aerobic-type carbon monoxide dehydrogenase small subunit (CoxS/CutS family)
MRFTLNGNVVDVRAHPMKRLLDVLREECGLTGTKEGCGEGECGACTVLVGGRAVNSCLVPFGQVKGAEVVTIEGLSASRLKDAFVRHGGTQCGFCTPGIVVAASRISAPATPAVMREALAGNLCRCTGYSGIYRAIEDAVSPAAPGVQVRGTRAKRKTRAAAAPGLEARGVRTDLKVRARRVSGARVRSRGAKGR